MKDKNKLSDCISTSTLSDKLLGFKVTVKYLKERCGLVPLYETSNGSFWLRSDYKHICNAIKDDIDKGAKLYFSLLDDEERLERKSLHEIEVFNTLRLGDRVVDIYMSRLNNEPIEPVIVSIDTLSQSFIVDMQTGSDLCGPYPHSFYQFEYGNKWLLA